MENDIEMTQLKKTINSAIRCAKMAVMVEMLKLSQAYPTATVADLIACYRDKLESLEV